MQCFRYNKLARTIRDLAKKVSEIDAKDPFRTEMSSQLLEKLYVLGLIPTKWDLNLAVNISASSFCRRRLPVVMLRSEYHFHLQCNIYVGRYLSALTTLFSFMQITCPNSSRTPPI